MKKLFTIALATAFIGVTDVHFALAQNEAMYIDGDGKVLVKKKLDVSGDIISNGNFSTGGNVLLAGTHLTYNSLNGVIDWGSGGSGNLFFRSLTTQGVDVGFRDLMTIAGNGNVGIGTSIPQNKLQINGNLHLDGHAIFFRGGNPVDSNDVIKWNGATDRLDIAGWNGVTLGYTNGPPFSMTPVLTAMKGGNVGIGVSTPLSKLHVLGDIYMGIVPENEYTDVHNRKYVGKRRIGMLSGDFAGIELETERYHDKERGNGGLIKFFTWGYNVAGSREVMRIDEKGRVGIGTGDSEPQAPLEVQGYANYSTGDPFGYLNKSGGMGRHDGHQDRKVSILASYDICTKDNFISYSDSRIKTGLVRSDHSKDLATLNQLQVTDFKYIDTLHYGVCYKKGFVAQEVEKVFPEAVGRGNEFIPDIYSVPTKVNTTNGMIIFSMKRQHGLKDGDVVRFFVKDCVKEKKISVLGKFTFSITDSVCKYDDVFVFGKKVNDFRTVDYDRLYTLNISATQQLYKEIEMLKTENDKLRKENVAVQELMANIESRLSAIESKVDRNLKTARK